MSERTCQHCDFCGKSEHEVASLICAPYVAICDECIALCVGILAKPPTPSGNVGAAAARAQ